MEKTDFSAFGQYIPGFDFLQNLARQATGVTPGLQPAAGAMPGLGHWVAPIFSIEEIDKRIQDLRAVAFWLEQNAKALDATIQALEVQKMTLSTLENMNLSLQDVAESFKMKPEAAQPSQASQPGKAAEAPAQDAAQAAAEASKPAVDAMQWWNSLTEQFASIATHAVQDMAGQAAKAAEQMAQSVQASAEAAEKMAEQARAEAERHSAQVAEEQAVARKPARKTRAAAKSSATQPAAKKSAAGAKKTAPAKSRSKPAAG